MQHIFKNSMFLDPLMANTAFTSYLTDVTLQKPHIFSFVPFEAKGVSLFTLKIVWRGLGAHNWEIHKEVTLVFRAKKEYCVNMLFW